MIESSPNRHVFRGNPQAHHNRRHVSIVVSAYNEQNNVAQLWLELSETLNNMIKGTIDRYEVIFVDDGSKDLTFKEILKITNNYAEAKVVKLSRNFGHEIAMTAGMDYAKGDCVICMDADLQHPPQLLPELIREWQNGHDIVMTKRTDEGGGGWLRKTFYQMAYGFLNALQEEKIPSQSPDFRLIDRHYVDILKNMDERDRMLRGLLSWVADGQFVFVEFSPGNRFSGESKYSFQSLFKLGLDGIVSFTDKPLRWAIYLGILALFFSLSLGAFTVWHHFSVDNTKTGYATILVSMLFMSSINLIVLGVLGVYLGKIHFEVKKRPLYVAKYFD